MYRIQYLDPKDAKIRVGEAHSIDLVVREVTELLITGVKSIRVDATDANEKGKLDELGKPVAKGITLESIEADKEYSQSRPKPPHTDMSYFIDQATLTVAAYQWVRQLSEEESKKCSDINDMSTVQAYCAIGPNRIPTALRAWVASRLVADWGTLGWSWAQAQMKAGYRAEDLAAMWIMSVQGLTGGLATKFDGYPMVRQSTAPDWR